MTFNPAIAAPSANVFIFIASSTMLLTYFKNTASFSNFCLKLVKNSAMSTPIKLFIMLLSVKKFFINASLISDFLNNFSAFSISRTNSLYKAISYERRILLNVLPCFNKN